MYLAHPTFRLISDQKSLSGSRYIKPPVRVESSSPSILYYKTTKPNPDPRKLGEEKCLRTKDTNKLISSIMRKTGDFKDHIKQAEPKGIVRIQNKSNHSKKVIPFTLRYFQQVSDSDAPTCESRLSPTEAPSYLKYKIASNSNLNLSKRPQILDRNHHSTATLNQTSDTTLINDLHPKQTARKPRTISMEDLCRVHKLVYSTE